ncbi:MAG TPA: L-threonylcarbamoyladenylate synthase [Terrimicrobiaceae bacterium]
MKTRVVTAPEGLREAAELLASGDLVALPTETVYGLGAAALDPLACAKIFEAKERPLSDPLIVHLPDIEWLERISQPNELAIRLVEEFWPGPLTMVLPRTKLVPDLVTSGQDTVALRMSAHPIFRQIAQIYGKPIAAPSANRFGRISPTAAEHVVAELGGRIPLIVDGGPCVHGLESTIALVLEQGVEILRHGPITKERLSELGIVLPRDARILTPGTMESHYAPRTPLIISRRSDTGHFEGRCWPKKTGVILWSQSEEEFECVEYLSRKQDFREAAANLYAAMRRLDEADLDLIVAEAVPETGLGVAIMERLRKAAARE